jgi:FkbM family methyltransferase
MRRTVPSAVRRLAQRARDARLPKVATLDWDGRPIRVRVASRRVAYSRLHPVAKEPWTASWIERSVGPDDVLWDIGANIGGYSLIAAAAGAGRVVAVEPMPANYAALCENIALNAFADTIVPAPLLLAAANGVETLGISELAAGAASHAVGEGTPQSTAVEVVARQPVLGITLDDAVAVLGLPAPTLVKLDVDGAEADVLAGGRRTLSAPSVRSVLIEIERRREPDVLELVSACGLRLVDRVDDRDGTRLAYIWYGVFERAR